MLKSKNGVMLCVCVLMGIMVWTAIGFSASKYSPEKSEKASEEKVQITDDTEVYHCPVCDTDFMTKHEWENYVDLNHPEDKDKHVPEKVKWSERKKQKKAKGQMIYHCEICDSGFITEQEWRNYMQLNYPEVDLETTRPKRIRKGEEKTEKAPKEIYFCEVCDSGFITKTEWEHYMKLNYPHVDTSELELKKIPYEEMEKNNKNK